ncbi:MAG: peptidylprolyl isomerase [Phenylobacterium sp.]|uniref:peptidylprolyl isomerase n=1 Tax=Phenylobacterium sp. TaxID=1871053 RepID=UPI00391BCBD6
MRTIVVEGVQIPERLIAQEAQNHPGADGGRAWADASHALAVKALLLDRARALGLTPEAETDDAGREETPEEALVRQVLELEVEATEPSEAECRRVYEAHPDRFCAPMLYEAAHILFEPLGPDEASWAEAEALAGAALAGIRERPARFAEIARAASHCPSGQVGGSLGQLRAGDLVPEIEAALLQLPAGEVAALPVRSRFGWHVLKMVRRVEPRRVPFELAAERIRLHLQSRAWTAAATRYVGELAEAARRGGAAVALAEEGALAAPSPTLGALFASADMDRLEPWLEAVDPALLTRARAAAEAEGLPLADFVRTEAAAFVDEADDEAWTQLISAAQGAPDPALAGLAALLKSKVAPPKRTLTLVRRAAR